MSHEGFVEEVERARSVYDRYRADGWYETVWSPLDVAEVEYRSQQLTAMASLMRSAGFADLRGRKVLDVGCGNGRHLRMFVDMGAKPADLHGVDIHEPSLALARSLSPNLRFTQFNGWEIPLEDESVDLVTQFVVFSSIGLGDLRAHLASEMERVLRPEGHILWWDTLKLSGRAGDNQQRLDLELLFPNLSKRQVHVRRRPSVGESVRLPRWAQPVRTLLDRLPLVNYPPTHLAALVGPKP